MWRQFSRFVRIRSFNRDQSRSMTLPDKRLKTPEDFAKLAHTQLMRLTESFQKLKVDNPSIELELDPLKLTLSNGVYSVRVDSQRQAIFLEVPNEGAFEYYYDDGNQRWIGWADGHMMEELLARSVLSKVQGYLDL